MKIILVDFLSDNSDLFAVINAETSQKIVPKLQELFQEWSTLFKKLIQTSEQQLKLIALVEDLCIEFTGLYNFFHVIVQILCINLEVLTPQAIIEWSRVDISQYPTSEGFKEVDSTYHGKFLMKSKKFVDGLVAKAS
jgi:hypothetical protein